MSSGKLLALFLLALLSGCEPKGKPSGTAAIASGLMGQAVMGPSCPGYARPDRPCPDKPVEASFQIVDLNGMEVLKFKSDTEGRFKVSLPPGRYGVYPDPDVPFPVPGAKLHPPQEVEVKASEFTTVRLFFDSGMR
jgi:hypothetical protein